jgi:hypothetical protein
MLLTTQRQSYFDRLLHTRPAKELPTESGCVNVRYLIVI